MEKREVQTPYGALAYTLHRKKMKTLRLRVLRDGEVAASAPYHVPAKEVDAFVLKKAQLLWQASQKQKEAYAKSCAPYKIGGSVCLLGQAYVIQTHQNRAQGSFLKDGILHLYIKGQPSEQRLASAMQAFLHTYAQSVFCAALDTLEPIFKRKAVKRPALYVRRMKSLYGSCAVRKGAITINQSLVHVPMPLILYVVAHEMCHFLVPNHSGAFYALLEEIMPDYKARKRALKESEKML